MNTEKDRETNLKTERMKNMSQTSDAMRREWKINDAKEMRD